MCEKGLQSTQIHDTDNGGLPYPINSLSEPANSERERVERKGVGQSVMPDKLPFKDNLAHLLKHNMVGCSELTPFKGGQPTKPQRVMSDSDGVGGIFKVPYLIPDIATKTDQMMSCRLKLNNSNSHGVNPCQGIATVATWSGVMKHGDSEVKELTPLAESRVTFKAPLHQRAPTITGMEVAPHGPKIHTIKQVYRDCQSTSVDPSQPDQNTHSETQHIHGKSPQDVLKLQSKNQSLSEKVAGTGGSTTSTPGDHSTEETVRGKRSLANGSNERMIDAIIREYAKDPLFSKRQLATARQSRDPRLKPDGGGTSVETHPRAESYDCVRKLWLYDGRRVMVPSGAIKLVLEGTHNSPLGGHVGIKKTLELIQRHWYWPGLRTDVEQYVKQCDACQRNKVSNQKKSGLLQPLPVPGRRWSDVTTDMIVKLPKTSRGFDSILTFVDRLSKMIILIPTKEAIDAQQFAQLFYEHVVCKHGMPVTLVSDRGTLVNNAFWRALTKLIQLDHRMSSAYHPQTDGQTERTNRVVEEMLRSYIRPDQRDWDEHLPSCEFAINNSVHSTTGFTPFYLCTGQHPLTPATMHLPISVPAASHYAEGIEEIVKEAKLRFIKAQERMQYNADKHRKDEVFLPGEKVLLTTIYSKKSKKRP